MKKIQILSSAFTLFMMFIYLGLSYIHYRNGDFGSAGLIFSVFIVDIVYALVRVFLSKKWSEPLSVMLMTLFIGLNTWYVIYKFFL